MSREPAVIIAAVAAGVAAFLQALGAPDPVLALVPALAGLVTRFFVSPSR